MFQLDWLTSKPPEPICLCLPSVGVTDVCSGDLNSWPHACAISTLPTGAISPAPSLSVTDLLYLIQQLPSPTMLQMAVFEVLKEVAFHCVCVTFFFFLWIMDTQADSLLGSCGQRSNKLTGACISDTLLSVPSRERLSSGNAGLDGSTWFSRLKELPSCLP